MEEKRLVVLYSTTRAPLPLHSEVYLGVISKTLDYFKNNTDRFLLIWRPHPFLRNELAERYPALLSEYDETVAQFRREGWGRFSISESIDELVEVSDVWYGYYSDVTEKFHLAGKRVIIQSFCEEYNFVVGITKYKNYIYGSLYGKNAIIRLDLNTGHMEYVSKFPSQDKCDGVLFHYSNVMNEEIVFVPFLGKNLQFLNLNNNTFRTIKLNLRDELRTIGRGDFIRIIPWGNKWYLLPFGYRAILCVDNNTGECEHKADLSTLYSKDKFPYLFTTYVIKNNYMFMPSLHDNSVLRFDFETANVHIYHVGSKGIKFNEIVLVNERIYLVIKNALGIMEWNPDTLEEELYNDLPKGVLGNEKYCFDDWSAKVYENKIYLLPACANSAIKFDISNKTFYRISCFDEYMQNVEKNRSAFDTVTIAGNQIYAQNQIEQLICFDYETESIGNVYDLKLNQELETTIELSELDEYSRL